MEVLYRDDHFLAVMKPAGLASVRERWTDAESALVAVWDVLRADDAGARKPRVVHRLDKETTGVLLFATSLAAARSLSRQFKERVVEKTYAAIVLGTPPEDEGRIEVRIDEDRGRPGRVKVVEKRGKPSLTEYRVAERFRGYALLAVTPRTGRMHQIRVSLRHHGYPLLVDQAYGGHDALFLSELKPGYKRKKDQPERPLLGRLSLHAERIALDHPITGERVEIQAPLPKDLTLALKYLRKYRKL
jgi:RluA family pseudouridine synthase